MKREGAQSSKCVQRWQNFVVHCMFTAPHSLHCNVLILRPFCATYSTLHYTYAILQNTQVLFPILLEITRLQCGYFSNPFPIERGCRQGDAIAHQLFILSVQILTLMINANQSIRGIIIDDEEFKLTQFAEGTTLVVNETVNSSKPP